jgi:predicted phosphodiesterase
VIAELAQIAPVDVARGNRDWSFHKTAMVNHLRLAGVPVALMHGHISWVHYLLDKGFYIFQGYRFRRYLPFLLRAARDARVIVFGHTHHAENKWVQGRLFFNPGAAGVIYGTISGPSWGLLSFYPGGKVEGEIFTLQGYRLVKGEWIKGSLEFS